MLILAQFIGYSYIPSVDLNLNVILVASKAARILCPVQACGCSHLRREIGLVAPPCRAITSLVCSSEASAVSATIDGKASIFFALNSASFSDQRDRAFVDYLQASMLQYKPDEERTFVLFCSICF